MSTASEEIAARYGKIEREPDSLGRIIGVKRLKPHQQMKVADMVASDNQTVVQAYNLVAAVCMIDELPLSFPRSKGELESLMDALDTEGIGAASVAYGRLLGISEENTADAAKN